MTDPIDYSRPVGWWCPVCGASGAIANKNYAEHYAQGFLVCGDGCGSIIRPVYLPIPEGQRPLVDDEVATGEAEVCTGSLRDGSPCCWVTVDAVYAPDNGWLASIVHLAEYADADHIDDIAQASARARIVTGATE